MGLWIRRLRRLAQIRIQRKFIILEICEICGHSFLDRILQEKGQKISSPPRRGGHGGSKVWEALRLRSVTPRHDLRQLNTTDSYLLTPSSGQYLLGVLSVLGEKRLSLAEFAKSAKGRRKTMSHAEPKKGYLGCLGTWVVNTITQETQ
jgi:hypothetical protein